MDTRGQPVQVGVIILFGFLVIAFAIFQAVVVPQQNAEVEFQHSQAVTNDMQQLRNDIVETGAAGSTQTAAVKLGTTYPPRVFAVNPAPSSGSLRSVSVGSGEISLDAPGANIESICGYDKDGDGAVPSKSLVYNPNYNVYTAEPTVTYENSVVFRQQNGVELVDSGQTVIKGKTISIPALVSSYQRSGSTTALIDITSGKTGVGSTNATEETELTIPTDLSATKWTELLADEEQVQSVTENGDGTVTITLTPAEYQITCPVDGVGTTPDNNPTRLATQNGNGAGSINPTDPGDVRLSDIKRSATDQDVLVLNFTNPGGDVNLSEARFNFYQSSSDDGPSQLDLSYYDSGVKTIDDLELTGNSKEPTPTMAFSGEGDVTRVAVRFEESGGSQYTKVDQGDIAVLNLLFSDGQTANYFINVPKTNVRASPPTDGGGGGGTPTATPTPSGGGGSSPAVNQLTADEGGGNSYNVNYDVSDSDGDLNNVTLVLEASDGTEIDTVTVYDRAQTNRVQGNDNSLRDTGPNSPSRVRLIAIDAAGNRKEDTDPV